MTLKDVMNTMNEVACFRLQTTLDGISWHKLLNDGEPIFWETLSNFTEYEDLEVAWWGVDEDDGIPYFTVLLETLEFADELPHGPTLEQFCQVMIDTSTTWTLWKHATETTHDHIVKSYTSITQWDIPEHLLKEEIVMIGVDENGLYVMI